MQALSNVFTGVVWGGLLPEGVFETNAVRRAPSKETFINKAMHEMCFSTTFTTQVWEFSTYNGIGLQLICTLALGAMVYVTKTTSPDSCQHEWCALIGGSMLMMSRLTTIVNVIALFYFGNIVLGTAVLTMFAFAFLAKNGYLPTPVRDGYRYLIKNPCFMLATAIATPTMSLGQIVAVADIAFYLYRWYNSRGGADNGNDSRNGRGFSFDDMSGIAEMIPRSSNPRRPRSLSVNAVELSPISTAD